MTEKKKLSPIPKTIKMARRLVDPDRKVGNRIIRGQGRKKKK